jgi:hypothetical protein
MVSQLRITQWSTPKGDSTDRSDHPLRLILPTSVPQVRSPPPTPLCSSSCATGVRHATLEFFASIHRGCSKKGVAYSKSESRVAAVRRGTGERSQDRDPLITLWVCFPPPVLIGLEVFPSLDLCKCSPVPSCVDVIWQIVGGRFAPV